MKLALQQLSRIFSTTAILLLCTITSGFAEGTIEQTLMKDGKFYADMRYRYEYVNQGGFTEEGRASTLRTKAGFKTGVYKDFQALLEFELSSNLGPEKYNDTVNGMTKYPVIADPEGAELNQAWLSWVGIPSTKIKLGRQAVNLDNQRFIGTVGFRQNDQTYDAAVITNSAIPYLTLLYGYVRNVNRINGDDHPLGDLDTKTHLTHIELAPADYIKLIAYGYWWEVDLVSALSAKTYGLRLTGDIALNENWALSYELEGAKQNEHANNKATSYNEKYWHVAPGIKWNNLAVQAGFESLSGDGTNSFQTPFATGHKFNGWGDKFLSTPVAGLEDLYGKVVYRFDGLSKWINGTELTGVYHDFNSESGSTDYGEEWDLQLSYPLPTPSFLKSMSIGLKYADYNAHSFSVDTEKFWLTFSAKF